MRFNSSEVSIPLQKLLVALLIVLIPITIFGLYIGVQARQQVQEVNGAHFRTITQASSLITTNYVVERVAELVQIANEPGVQRAVVASNAVYAHMTDATIRSQIEQEESRWNTPASDSLLKNILGSDLARSIRRHRELNPKLFKITVVDQAGAAIAATDKPLRYSQTENEYWLTLAKTGKPSLYISEVRYDDQSRAQFVSITAPVFQEDSGRCIGAVTALVDMSPLFTTLNQMQIGRTGHVFLVKDDGIVVAASGLTPSGRVRSEEFIAVNDALGTLQGREAGYVQATLRNGEGFLIGFADTGLKSAYPNLPWIVIASQNLREAEGPIRGMATFAMVMTALALVILSVLCAYVFLHRRQRLQDIEGELEAEKKQTVSV
jgi:hypothetical protein